MSENRIYAELRRYFEEKGDEIGYDEVSFMIIASAENDTQLQVGAALIDPSMPTDWHGIPHNMPLHQQVLVYTREMLQPVFEQAKEMAEMVNQLKSALGEDKLQKLVDAASNSQDFMKRVIAEIEAHGTG